MERGPCAPFPHKIMKGQVYLISSPENPFVVKIGRTNKWSRRRSQLKVGTASVEELVVACDDMLLFEKELHLRFSKYRLPQSEWFVLPGAAEKDLVRQAILAGGEQVFPKVSDGPLAEKSFSVPSRQDPLSLQMEYWLEEWHEDFVEISVHNPWIIDWVHEWEDDGGWYVWVEYINPLGQEEQMCFAMYEIDKLHVYCENWQSSDGTWHKKFLGRNCFDISLNSEETIELIYKNVFDVFGMFNQLPLEQWPIQVRANKLAQEQRSLELRALWGPPVTAEEARKAFDEATRLVK